MGKRKQRWNSASAAETRKRCRGTWTKGEKVIDFDFDKLLKASNGKRVCIQPSSSMSPYDFMRLPQLLAVAAEVAVMLPKEHAELFRANIRLLAQENPGWSKITLVTPGDTRYDAYFHIVVIFEEELEN